MAKASAPEGLPRRAMILLTADAAYCNRCDGLVRRVGAAKIHSLCGARFVAIGSVLGVRDPRLSIRSDLRKVDLMLGRMHRPKQWITADLAEQVVRDMRVTLPRQSPRLRPGDMNNVIRRLAGFAHSQVESYEREEPFPYLGRDKVELRGVVEYFAGPRARHVVGVGPKAQADLRAMYEWLIREPDDS